MTEPSEAMKAMARRIASEFAAYNDTAVGCAIASIAEKVALAAIIETQEACAKLAESFAPDGDPWTTALRSISREIRTGNHYTKDESNGN